MGSSSLGREQPALALVVEATSLLRKTANWIAAKADAAADAFVKSVGTAAGVAVVAAIFSPSFRQIIDDACNWTIHWLHTVTLPF
jgi:hypothetical protein